MDKISKLGLILILASASYLMWNSSTQETATQDELAHIPAGYGYVKYLDYRLNPEHPPLVKVLAALPLTLMNLNFPDKDPSWTSDVNSQWTIGTKFLYESGNDADQILKWTRTGPILLTLLLIILTYFWSKELLGQPWALLPAILVAFSPTVMAHGHYVTTDIGAALGITAAIYFFSKFLLNRSRKNLVLAGLSFGFAQLLKFSAVILIPFFILVVIAIFLFELKRDWQSTNFLDKFKTGFGHFRSLFLVFAVGYLLVYPVYFVTTINYPMGKQVEDTKILLTSFGGGPTPDGENCRPIRCLAETDIAMAGNPITRAYAQYLLGVLMVGERAMGGNQIYFLGDVKNSGGPLYFPFVFIAKEPLTSLMLMTGGLFILLRKLLQGLLDRKIRIRDYFVTNLPEMIMGLFVITYLSYSIKSSLNIGLRHLLPIMPFVYILTVSGVKSWFKSNNLKKEIKVGLITLLLGAFVWDNVSAYPFYISYFNDLVGTDNGWKYVTDSNYDWGQDLKRLADFAKNPPRGEKIDKIAVDYFGGGNPKYYLGEDKVKYWRSSMGDPRESGIKWLAVSINILQGAKGKLYDNLPRTPEDEYRWLGDYEHPYARAGKSIFIYKLD